MYLSLPNNRRIAYSRLSGRSPGVVFLSGFKSDMSGTKAVHLEEFCRARGQAFVRFDYTGHGQSSGAFEEGTIGDWRQDALDVIDQLTEGPQVLVGSSMGGWIALLLALARPARVKALVGLAAAPDFTERLVWRQFTDAQKQEMVHKGKVMIPDCYGDEPYAITRKLVEEGRNHLLLDAPIPIRCPVRLIHGAADADVPTAIALELLERLESADVQLQLIKDAGHRLSEPEQLALLTSTLETLLS